MTPLVCETIAWRFRLVGILVILLTLLPQPLPFSSTKVATMPGVDEADLAGAVAEAHRPSISAQAGEKHLAADMAYAPSMASGSTDSEPTMEELKTLRRVSGKIGWRAFTITFVEFCERFSWYGTTALFVNFIQQPRPYGSRTGAINMTQECFDAVGEGICEQPGGLGQGQRASTGLTTFNQFWAYVMPLLGGYLADTYLGRFNTIQLAILCGIIGHVLLIVSSLPTVMDNPEGALGCFGVGLVILGIGTGCFKSNISPLLAEQLPQKRPEVISLKSGERVIRDPAVTLSRAMLYFYMMINIGSLTGGIGMVYAERFVGFWLAYMLPTILFFVAPVVLFVCKKGYTTTPPTGDVTSKAFHLLALASKGCWASNPVKTYHNFHREGFWDRVKPSNLGPDRPSWMHGIDDAWVDQVARGFNACKVFCWLPLYWLAYNQMVGNLTSQSATMSLNGVPNDLINNLNPLTLVIFIPFIDYFLYPAFRKAKIRFTPIKRIAVGFAVASCAMISSTVMQYVVTRPSPLTSTTC